MPDTCWYYLNKKLNPHLLTMVARVIDEGPHVHEATIQISTEDKWVDISDVQVELTNIIGLAAPVESKGSSEYDSTLTVKFFDKANHVHGQRRQARDVDSPFVVDARQPARRHIQGACGCARGLLRRSPCRSPWPCSR